MATKDNHSGLLSKMAKFVRNPTKDWSELDAPEAPQDSSYSKGVLKEIIERKRQNDFVRRREFDHLRKLRRNVPLSNPDPANTPSFFQTSMVSNHDERAMTLKKIDEIEAQMSKQWWKGRQEGGAVPVGRVPVTAPARDVKDGGSAFYPTQAPETTAAIDSLHGADYDSTQMGVTEPAYTMPLTEPQQMRQPDSLNFDPGLNDFSTSKLFSVEVCDGQTDADLEEAAIRFANGDDAGAEAGLLAALAADPVAPDAADRWAAALFDLYRATGQQASFDSVAIDYAMRFGRSAPAWFSIPDLLGRPSLASPLTPALSAPGQPIIWECPPELDWHAVQGLLESGPAATGPWHLQWRQLRSITPDAAQVLADVFAQWCEQSVTLYFGGAEVLEKTLRSFTPSGDKQVELFWWRLRLDALRILRLQDEFELAALDYCVIYEVSPPPWAETRCHYFQERIGAPPVLDLLRPAVQTSARPTSELTPAPAVPDVLPASVVELTGEVLGDAAQALDDLQSGLKGADRLVISCSRLIRVDFSAAGSILNWVAVRESEGCKVQFRDVPRLVAAFFNVIGINEHARVVLRTS